MELVDVGTSEEWSTEVDWVDKSLQYQWTDAELGRVCPDLEVDARSLSKDLHRFPGGSGAYRQLGNWFQLVGLDSQSLHGCRGDDVGEGVPAVDVRRGPNFA